ncbi:MAG: recombination protein O N-terminal domain-containing protein [Hymenobacter sp.]
MSYLKYRESSSIIARVYTEQRGVQSYLVNGVRGPSRRERIALFQPLTLLGLVACVPRQGVASPGPGRASLRRALPAPCPTTCARAA